MSKKKDKGETLGGPGKIHLHPKANTAGFKQNPQNIAKRKPSIRTALKNILEGFGTMAIPKAAIQREDDENIYVKVPNETQLALKLMNTAMNRGGHVSLKAIEMIIESVDGKITTEQDVESLYETLKKFALKDDHDDQGIEPIRNEKDAMKAVEDIDFQEMEDAD